MIRIAVLLMLICSNINISYADKVKKNEDFYNRKYCKQVSGFAEYTLESRVRIDCLTETHAIEMDWARKWYEGVTQALYYSMKTGKRAKLVLIIRSESDKKYYYRALEFQRFYSLPLDIEIITS